VHFVSVSVELIVDETHVRFTMSIIAVIRLIPIALRNDVSVTTHVVAGPLSGSIVEAASNVGRVDWVVVSLINKR
jgi:hypothetical protein